jgi:hypothetical protein
MAELMKINTNSGSNSPATGNDSDRSPPLPPSPSQDKGLIPVISPTGSAQIKNAPSPPDFAQGPAGPGSSWEFNSLEPYTAMKMLARCVTALVEMTGDVPPTPPALVASRTLRNRLSLVFDAATTDAISSGIALNAATTSAAGRPRMHRRTSSRPGTPVPSQDILRPGFSHLSVGAPEATADEPGVTNADVIAAKATPNVNCSENTAGVEADEDVTQLMMQQQIIARKFFCKTPPPVSIEAYLTRMQHWCPMSTAVYLAATCYICKLCVEDRVVPATSRTAHRLVLASLRVAMKALEDLRYPQDRFAIVGGVKQEELRALEISLCYLMDFELQLSNSTTERRVGGLLQIVEMRASAGRKNGKENGMALKLPMRVKAGT